MFLQQKITLLLTLVAWNNQTCCLRPQLFVNSVHQNLLARLNFFGEETICSTGELVTCIVAHAVVLFLSDLEKNLLESPLDLLRTPVNVEVQ